MAKPITQKLWCESLSSTCPYMLTYGGGTPIRVLKYNVALILCTRRLDGLSSSSQPWEMSISLGVRDRGWSLCGKLHTAIGVILCQSHSISLRYDLNISWSCRKRLVPLDLSSCLLVSLISTRQLWDLQTGVLQVGMRQISLSVLATQSFSLFDASCRSCLVLRACAIRAKKSGIGLRDLGQMI